MFRAGFCSSPGGDTLHIQQLVYVMRYVDWLLAGSGSCQQPVVPPDDEQ